MLVLLGGLRGSGKREMAQELARREGFFHYVLDQHRPRSYFLNEKKEMVTYSIESTSDEDHIRIFKRACADFPLLSKMYRGVVITDQFHRKKPRDFLLSQARRYFSVIHCVWIEHEEQLALQRIYSAHQTWWRSGADSLIEARNRSKESSELEDPLVKIFSRTEDLDASVSILLNLLKTCPPIFPQSR